MKPRSPSLATAHGSKDRTLALDEAVAAIESTAAGSESRTSPEVEVRNYFDALALIDDKLDVAPDEDWMRRLHATIMRGARSGRPRERSEYRQGTVQIGNFAYVPPDSEDVPGLMADLSDWASTATDELPDYLVAAILAYQFVTIRPFMDGNGRCTGLRRKIVPIGDGSKAVY